jgi:hypothetical protein
MENKHMTAELATQLSPLCARRRPPVARLGHADGGKVEAMAVRRARSSETSEQTTARQEEKKKARPLAILGSLVSRLGKGAAQ